MFKFHVKQFICAVIAWNLNMPLRSMPECGNATAPVNRPRELVSGSARYWPSYPTKEDGQPTKSLRNRRARRIRRRNRYTQKADAETSSVGRERYDSCGLLKSVCCCANIVPLTSCERYLHIIAC
ncbi:hypothetical protein PENSPDRAFT_87619 [Peniophora sp. CONT]|nr:hypothetical protein PENSPDRAFT_87619 [Peniophora sp. CONT]